MNNSIYKKGLAVVLAIALIIMTVIGIKLSDKQSDITFAGSEETIKNNLSYTTEESDKNNIIVVDIDGAVLKPGVYEFFDGERVNDAILKAGGLAEDAYTKELNKARKLVDGEKIYILKIGEEPESSLNSQNFADNSKININTATKEMLMTLNGIGEIYADRIIDYREKNKFSSIEEIKNVNGIGEKTFEKLKDFIAVK